MYPPFIKILCVASPVMSCYGKLRAEARSLTSTEIHRIRTLLYHRTSTPFIYSRRMSGVAKLLILFNSRLGGMIRCLGNVYTSDFLDFSSIDACLIALYDIPVDPGEPLHDFPALEKLFHQHIPFKASFRSARRDMHFRNLYNNNRASNAYLSSIHEK